MKIEERLHDAMHEYADTIEPDPDSWSRISSRFDDAPTPRRPVPGRLVFAGVAITLVIVLITVLAIRDEGPTSKVTTDPNGFASPMPSRILAITVAKQPVVLRSEDSLRLDGFGSTTGIAAGAQIAVTPDGERAFVVMGDGNEGCADHSVYELPLAPGGPSGNMFGGATTSPTVSPDGRYLAFLRCLPGDGRADEIVRYDLASGATVATPAPAGTAFVGQLAFAADSRHVLFQVSEEAQGTATLHELDLVGGEAAPGRVIPVDPAIFVFGYLGTTGELLGEDARQNPTRVVALSATTGETLRTILTTDTLPDPPANVDADASGRHLLLQVGGTLYRWSEGDQEPTKLVGSYLDGVWIPDPAEAPSDQSTESPSTLPPPAVLIVTTDDRIVSMGTPNGEVHESLVAMPNLLAAGSIPPHTAEAIYETMGQGGACNQPLSEIGRVTLATGQKTRIVSGAVSPTVSPDGRFVAYGIVCDGITLGFTDLRDGMNYRIDPGAKRAPAALQWIEPLAWAPDSEQVLYRAVFRGSEDPSYWVGRVGPLLADAGSREMPDSSHVSAAAFVDDQNVALAEPTGRNTSVRMVRIGTRSEGVRSSFDVPGRITQLAVDRSGRHFLAVTDDHVLYRWSRGDPEPTKLADDAVSSTWIPRT